MDFDLFDSNEDDDIFASVHLQPTLKNSEPLCSDIENLPEFQCFGDDRNNAQFSEEGFIKCAFVTSLERYTSHNVVALIDLSPYGFSYKEICGQAVTKYLFGEAFLNVQHLVASVQGGPLGNMYENSETTNYQRRQHVSKLLHLILHCSHKEQWPMLRSYVQKLRDLLNGICSKEMLKSIYFANSTKGNECNVPAYHLLHGILEWKLLDICILFKYSVLSNDKSDIEGQKLDFGVLRTQLEKLFDDLLTCSFLLYTKKRSSELLFSTPFPCTCFKEIWLVLLIALNEWNKNTTLEREEQDQLDFWLLFNKSLAELKLKLEFFSISILHFYEFSTWTFSAMTRLHGYRSNGVYEGSLNARNIFARIDDCDFLEQCTQKFLAQNPNEDQLRTHICLITPILLEWFRPRASIPMLLWEHFHKRLNSSFYIAGTAPSNLAVACGSGRAYLDRYRELLIKSQKTNPDPNICSYTLFALLLGNCLERLRTLTNGNQAQKLLGRIYSKFSIQKFLTLNELGIHHLIELFVILAICGDFKEMITKLRDSLLSISLEKITTQRQISVTKGHVALLILCAEQQCDLSEYITKLLQQINSIKNDVAVAKVLADGLLDIFKNSGDSFQNGENLLIDSWLPSLLQKCTPVEQERTFEAIHLIFEKLDSKAKDFITDSNNAEVIKALYTHILPFLKQQYTTSFSDRLPQLVADFCINADVSNFHKLLNFFVETPAACRQMLPQILLIILENEKQSSLIDARILMHVWLKSLVLLTPQATVVKQLTAHVVKLPIFNKMTNLASEEMLQAKEPLCVFVAAVGKAFDAGNYKLRCDIADNFNAYICNFEKWLVNGVDSRLEQQPEITMRFYSFIAIVIYNCPNIVYVKSKSDCFFHIAITRFILPTSIQMGKPPEGKLTQLVHKIWPVLVQGIGRLNFKTDSYIQKTLYDLIQKWTPLFKTVSTNTKVVARPFITCFLSDNNQISLHLCERLTSVFITTQRRQADQNACLVITIFQEIVTSILQDAPNGTKEIVVQRLQTFVKGISLLTLEHIMMVDDVVPSRVMLLELFRRIIDNAIFRDSKVLQEIFIEHLRIITKKHLAYYTFFYFDLLMKIAQISYILIEKLMDFLIAEIQIVEQKRGVGEDIRIRNCLQKLKEHICQEKTRQEKNKT